MQKVFGYICSLALLATLVSFHRPKKEPIHWMTIQELQQVYAKDPRPILIDVYTSWCGWCKVMDRETYTNDKVVDFISRNYYAVKFDAEVRDSVEWLGRKFGYNPAARANELAVYLLAGRMSYPTTIFIPQLDGRPAALAGYLKPSQIESVLKYFVGDLHKSINYSDFMKTFTPSW